MNKLKISIIIILISILILSCNSKRNVEGSSRTFLISDTLNNRLGKWEDSPMHDKRCLGFYKTHFIISNIKSIHFKSDNYKILDSITRIKWNKINTNEEVISFNKYFHKNYINEKSVIKNKVVYVAEMIYSESSQTKYLSIGSDDGVTFWVNGDSIFTRHYKGSGLLLHDDIIPIHLIPGNNIIVYKIDQGRGLWQLCTKLLNIEECNNVIAGAIKEKLYYDLPESCIIPDSVNYLVLKKNSKMILDSLDTVEISWENLSDTLVKTSFLGYMLPDTLFPHIKNLDFYLMRIKVKDKNKNVLSHDLIPIFKEGKVVQLISELLRDSSETKDPNWLAKIYSVKQIFLQSLMFEKKKVLFSTRVKAQALFDLYSFSVLGSKGQLKFMGPKIFGYYLEEDKNLQFYRVFVPPYLDNTESEYVMNLSFFYRYILKKNKGYTFWNLKLNRSHYYTIKYNSLASRFNTVIVLPYGGGTKNFKDEFVQEIPIIFSQLNKIFKFNPSGISFYSYSSGANIVMEMMLKTEMPVKYLGLRSPTIQFNNQVLSEVLFLLKEKYSKLKLFVRFGERDNRTSVSAMKNFGKSLKDFFSVDFAIKKYSGHVSYFREPDIEFFQFVNSN